VLPLVVIAAVRSASDEGGMNGLLIGGIAIVLGVVIYAVGRRYRDRHPVEVASAAADPR